MTFCCPKLGRILSASFLNSRHYNSANTRLCGLSTLPSDKTVKWPICMQMTYRDSNFLICFLHGVTARARGTMQEHVLCPHWFLHWLVMSSQQLKHGGYGRECKGYQSNGCRDLISPIRAVSLGDTTRRYTVTKLPPDHIGPVVKLVFCLWSKTIVPAAFLSSLFWWNICHITLCKMMMMLSWDCFLKAVMACYEVVVYMSWRLCSVYLINHVTLFISSSWSLVILILDVLHHGM